MRLSHSIKKTLRSIAASGRALRRRVFDTPSAWQSILAGGELCIGQGTRLDGASLTARDPTGCVLAIGDECLIECSIVLEKSRSRVHIGSRTQVGGGTLLDAACDIHIGDDVLIAFGALIMDHNSHSLAFRDRSHDVEGWLRGQKDWTHVERAPVTIGDKAWVGARAIILKGVSVGEGAIVAAGSIVTKDVPAWTIVAGNPAQVVRPLTDEERRLS